MSVRMQKYGAWLLFGIGLALLLAKYVMPLGQERIDMGTIGMMCFFGGTGWLGALNRREVPDQASKLNRRLWTSVLWFIAGICLAGQSLAMFHAAQAVPPPPGNKAWLSPAAAETEVLLLVVGPLLIGYAFYPAAKAFSVSRKA